MAMLQFWDLSLDISPELVTWPGDPKVEREPVSQIERGDEVNITRFSLCTHTGTHIDAPAHYLPRGSSVDEIPMDVLLGAVQVVQVADACDLITKETLQSAGIFAETRRLIFKTRNSHLWKSKQTEFQTDFVVLSADAAETLVKMGVRLVGIDYLSISPYDDDRPVHEVLLRAGVVIVEGLNLSQVEPGDYQLACLPLKLSGADGAPARVVLYR